MLNTVVVVTLSAISLSRILEVTDNGVNGFANGGNTKVGLPKCIT